MVLKELICNSFYFVEGVVVLKELICNSFYSCSLLICNSFYFGRVWWS